MTLDVCLLASVWNVIYMSLLSAIDLRSDLAHSHMFKGCCLEEIIYGRTLNLILVNKA